VNVPQIDAHVDREKAKTFGISLDDVFETMQVYLGALYVNDFKPVRPNVSGECAGGIELPVAAGRYREAESQERGGGNDSAGIGGDGALDVRAGPRDALQRISRGGDQRARQGRGTVRGNPKRRLLTF